MADYFEGAMVKLTNKIQCYLDDHRSQRAREKIDEVSDKVLAAVRIQSIWRGFIERTHGKRRKASIFSYGGRKKAPLRPTRKPSCSDDGGSSRRRRSRRGEGPREAASRSGSTTALPAPPRRAPARSPPPRPTQSRPTPPRQSLGSVRSVRSVRVVPMVHEANPILDDAAVQREMREAWDAAGDDLSSSSSGEEEFIL